MKSQLLYLISQECLSVIHHYYPRGKRTQPWRSGDKGSGFIHLLSWNLVKARALLCSSAVSGWVSVHTQSKPTWDLPLASFSSLAATLPFLQCVQESSGASDGLEARVCPTSNATLHANHREECWWFSGLYTDKLYLVYKALPTLVVGRLGGTFALLQCGWWGLALLTFRWAAEPCGRRWVPSSVWTSKQCLLVAFLCSIHLHSHIPTCKVGQDIGLDATNRPRIAKLDFSLAISLGGCHRVFMLSPENTKWLVASLPSRNGLLTLYLLFQAGLAHDNMKYQLFKHWNTSMLVSVCGFCLMFPKGPIAGCSSPSLNASRPSHYSLAKI